MKPSRILFVVVPLTLTILASVETLFAMLCYSSSFGASHSQGPFGISGILWQDSFQISVVSWTSVTCFVVALTFWKGANWRSSWKKSGFDKDTFDLLMKMRGGASRLKLLHILETPKHRSELSALTGIDWKEVDRQLHLLEKYGLVCVAAQSGSMKLYQTTEQGKMLIRLTGELGE